jgi:hypothetical protein
LASLPAIVRIINDLYKGIEIEKVIATKENNLDTNNRVNQNDFEKIIAIKNKIRKDGTNQWIDTDGMLVHEYYCKGKIQNYIKGNGTISVGLKIDNEGNKYVLSILSNGNHPDLFNEMICNYCEKNRWSSNNDLSYSVDITTSEDTIVNFMTFLLKEMKAYREKDTKE